MESRILDQHFQYILSLAHQLDLPTEAIFELSDHSYPPESFFTLTTGEWSSILSTRGINAEEVHNRISAWKIKMNTSVTTNLEESRDEQNCRIQQMDVIMETNCQLNAARSLIEDSTSVKKQEIEMPAIGVLKPSNRNIVSDNRDCVSGIDGTDKTFFTPNDLQELLQRTDTGKAILQNAVHGTLSKDSKKELSGIIAEDHIKRNGDQGRFSKDFLKNYSKCIKLLLPNEKHDMITYYIPAAPPERRNPGGSIHQAYKRLKKSFSRRQEREKTHQRKLSGKENASTSGVTGCDTNIDQATRWLQLNVNPWDIVLKMWKETIQPRVDSIRNIKSAEILVK